jgi:hypothetical protein
VKLKSKYNIGEIVQFKNPETKDIDVGSIDKVFISFSWEQLQKEEYMITPIRMRAVYVSDWVRVEKTDIRKKLNKIAFKRAYAEQCAKEMMKSE